LPELEPWYNIKYHAAKYSDSEMQLMLHPNVADDRLGLPPANNLIPTDFSVLEPEKEIPVLIKKWEETDLWFMRNHRFQKPKGNIAVKIYTSDLNFGSTPTARVFAEVWKNCLNEYLREFKYMADCADLTLEVTLEVDCVQLHWSGFSHTLPLFVKETCERMVGMRSANLESIFNQVKE
jgi:secreted Zn-dependent insulinase-like peptidase